MNLRLNERYSSLFHLAVDPTDTAEGMLDNALDVLEEIRDSAETIFLCLSASREAVLKKQARLKPSGAAWCRYEVELTELAEALDVIERLYQPVPPAQEPEQGRLDA